MKKITKSLSYVFTMLTVLIYVFCSSGKEAFADETPCSVRLLFEDGSGAYKNTSVSNEDLKVAGEAYIDINGGSYELSLTPADIGAEGRVDGVNVLCVDIAGIKELLDEYNLSYNISDVQVVCDGEQIPVDASKLVFGKAEENDNLRLEIYNVDGSTSGDNSPINSGEFGFEKELCVSFDIDVAMAPQKAYVVMTAQRGGVISTAKHPKSDPAFINGNGTCSINLVARDEEGDRSRIEKPKQFVIEIPGLAAQITDWTDVSVQDVSVLCDDEEVEVDQSLLKWGDLKEDGTFCINICTDGDEPVMAVKPEDISFRQNMVVTFTIDGIPVSFPQEVSEKYAPPVLEPEVTEIPEEPLTNDGEAGNDENTLPTGEPTPEATVTPEAVPTAEAVPTTEPTTEPTVTPAQSSATTEGPVHIRGLNEIERDNSAGLGTLAKIGIVLGIIIVVGGGVAAYILGREKE